jgi:hypothetical protein
MKTNRIQDPDTNPCSYSYFLFDKAIKGFEKICVGKKIVSSTNSAGKT